MLNVVSKQGSLIGMLNQPSGGTSKVYRFFIPWTIFIRKPSSCGASGHPYWEGGCQRALGLENAPS